MPDGLVNLLSDRQQFLDLAKYLIEVAEGGPKRAKELRPAQTAFVLPEYEKDIDHAGLIRALDDKAFKRGEAIYTRVCANCHGTKDQPGSLPTSPKFAAHKFKNGSDPYSLYQTLTHGYGLMAPQTWMVPRQKYDVIHYLREAYLKPHNPTQYAKVDDAYLAQAARREAGRVRPGAGERRAVGGDGLRPEPDEHLRGRRAGAEHRLQGHRGAAGRRGRAACRAARVGCCSTTTPCGSRRRWSGDGFIDWKGIHFNGQHQVHPKLVGERSRRRTRSGRAGPTRKPAASTTRACSAATATLRPAAARVGAVQGHLRLRRPDDHLVHRRRRGDPRSGRGRGGRASKRHGRFTRTLEVGKSSRDLLARIAPDGVGRRRRR